MMNDELKAALGVALNEASLLGFEFDIGRRLACATFAVLALPADGGPMPGDSRILLLFHNVGRLAVSLRGGRWSDPAAPILPVTVDRLLETVQSFGALPVYGWEFFDTGEREMAEWGNRLSLDWHASDTPKSGNTVTLFQEGADRHLDLCVWFDDLEARQHDGTEIPLEEFAAAGKRWWDAFYAHDPRTHGLGMFPLK